MAKMTNLLRYLDDNSVEYKLMEHLPAFSAHETAVATHVPEREIAKAILVRIDEKFWMSVLRADHRVNTQAIKRMFSARNVHLAHEEDLESLFPDCELGAMPPFGKLYGLPILVDDSLTEDEEIVFNACSHTKVVRMKFSDFKKVAKPLIGKFAEPPYKREEDW
ncbi:MAG: YbaK/EbsC family protein [Ignavibacteriales bacterium]|nr:YbaK/EbsC family protein [Ignavibacteriales bacterium]